MHIRAQHAIGLEHHVRRTLMFSPILATVRGVVVDGLARGQLAASNASTSTGGGHRQARQIGGEIAEVVLARDEIGLAIDLDHGGGVPVGRALDHDDPSAAMRAAFLSALASPCLRMSSAAASRSPLVSTSARLHSIMPAPVRSRSCSDGFGGTFMTYS